jgi:hypothetical protein
MNVWEEKPLTITLEDCSALLRVDLMTLYYVKKAKRNTAQVSFLHFQHLQ